MKYYIFMQGNLHSKPAGLQKSALQRATAFKKRGFDFTILTNHYSPNHNLEMSKLRDKGLLNNSVRSMYQDFELDGAHSSGEVVNDEFLSEYDIITDAVNLNWQRAYYNGEYRYFIVRDTSTQRIIKVKELFKSATVIKETTYDSISGRPVFQYLFDFRTGQKIRKNLLNSTGGVYYSETYDSKGNILEIQLFTQKGSYSFKSLGDITLHWLNEYVDDTDNEDVTIISEYAEFKEALINFKLQRQKKQLTTKILIALHNNHLDNGSIKPYFREIFSRMDDYDAVIALTEEQKNDLESTFGSENTNIFVVPHSIVHRDFTNITREPNRITVGARLAPVKNIEDSIRAIHLVIKKLPTVKFYIFGHGPLKDAYAKLINELNVSDSVVLKGFTDDMNEEYAKSDLAIMTSINEGFPLSLIEAMDAGAVPVVYPFKYGPRDMINNGVSGVIVSQPTYHDVADAVVDLLVNRFKLERLRGETQNISNIFSEDNMIDKWINVFNKV